MPAVRRQSGRIAWRRRWLAPGAAAILPVLLIGLAGCASSGSGRQASPGVAAYLHCLSRHDTGGARKACRSLRPRDGLGPALNGVASCLRSHGISVPAAAAGTPATNMLRFLAALQSGSRARQSALTSCVAQAHKSA